MSNQIPSIPKGTRDFSPSEMVKRNYIFDTVKAVFKKYGYLPIETPAMENLSTLLGKYGEEGDKLLFKILNSGDYFKGIDTSEITGYDSNKLSLQLCGKGLRYDLTVPFARYVAQHRNGITLPFKRYQIQPVWRADRPQKGRYREFYQCDVDVVGSYSLLNEMELIQIIDEIFSCLKIDVEIKLNNRKILAGIVEELGQQNNFNKIVIIIDKLDKIGIDNVARELENIGLNKSQIEELKSYIFVLSNNESKLKLLDSWLKESETGKKGVEEIKTLFDYSKKISLKNEIILDLTLARGLNYYTGAIIEVKAKEIEIGSICGGGRYDDLTGVFGLPGVPGVGISFGADRIYDVMAQLNLFPLEVATITKLLVANFGENESIYCLKLVEKLRNSGIYTELYPDPVKLKKQMNYANLNNIPYVALVGEDEMVSGEITVKDMKSGEQFSLTLAELIQKLKN